MVRCATGIRTRLTFTYEPASSPRIHPIHHIPTIASAGLDPCDDHIASIHPPADDIFSLKPTYCNQHQHQRQQSPLYIILFDVSEAFRPRYRLSSFFLLDHVIITNVQRLSLLLLTSLLILLHLAFLACAALTGATSLPLSFV